jgi:hypothetical protein
MTDNRDYEDTTSLMPARIALIATVAGLIIFVLLGFCSTAGAECLTSHEARVANPSAHLSYSGRVKGHKGAHCWYADKSSRDGRVAQSVERRNLTPKVADSTSAAAAIPEGDTLWHRLVVKLNGEKPNDGNPSQSTATIPSKDSSSGLTSNAPVVAPSDLDAASRKSSTHGSRKRAKEVMPNVPARQGRQNKTVETRPRPPEQQAAGADNIDDRLRSYAPTFPLLGYRGEKQRILLEVTAAATAKERLRLMMTEDAWMSREMLKEFEAWLDARAKP